MSKEHSVDGVSTSDLAFPELDVRVAEIVARYVIAERQRCARTAIAVGKESGENGAERYAPLRCILGKKIADKIRSGE